jgi:hypothetical protein
MNMAVLAFPDAENEAPLRIVGEALAEAIGLPPQLSRLDVMAANDNAGRRFTRLNRYRLNPQSNSRIGGRHGRHL